MLLSELEHRFYYLNFSTPVPYVKLQNLKFGD